ncbi:MAG TPA: phosphate acyltransferase PlsX [Bacteroidales bacterium]|nr:phosphate acyltransferase PlsX [Bacteroidales bacterium]
MKVGIDIMGGDFAPDAVIEGIVLAYNDMPSDVSLVLIGPENIIKQKLRDNNFSHNSFEIVHAPDTVAMGEAPTKVFTQKPESSIVKGFSLIKEEKIDAFISAGNSGAMLVGAIYSSSLIEGLSRPPILAHVPYENGKFGIILDVGANIDCKPENLVQFAILGSVYANIILKINNPKVGLINIGEEPAKGNILTQTTYQLLKDTKNINFIGNIEGWDLFTGKADVMVCDGFIGNIILKQTEGFYHMLVKHKLINSYFEQFNYERHGGSPVLGIKSTVIVGHGISNPKTIKTMIFQAIDIHKARLSEKLATAIKNNINFVNN